MEDIKKYYMNHMQQNSDFILGQTETYDTENENVISFHKVDDIVQGIECRLSNMAGGFPFKFANHTWQNSEVLYLCGEFSHNSREHQEIQGRFFRSKSGYAAKRFVKSKYKKQVRDDFKDFRLDWMLYVVWQKCLNNRDFCKLLLSTKDYILVEDTTTDNQGTAEVWGAQNKEQRSAREAALPRIEAKAERLFTRKADKDDYINKEYNKIQKGVFVGQNNIGKILMICRKCLIEGTQPKINYALLQKAEIYIFGVRLDFSDKISTPRNNLAGRKSATPSIQDNETDDGSEGLHSETLRDIKYQQQKIIIDKNMEDMKDFYLSFMQYLIKNYCQVSQEVTDKIATLSEGEITNLCMEALKNDVAPSEFLSEADQQKLSDISFERKEGSLLPKRRKVLFLEDFEKNIFKAIKNYDYKVTILNKVYLTQAVVFQNYDLWRQKHEEVRQLERELEAQVDEFLNDKAELDGVSEWFALAKEIKAVKEKLDKTTTDFSNGKINASECSAILKELEEERDNIRSFTVHHIIDVLYKLNVEGRDGRF